MCVCWWFTAQCSTSHPIFFELRETSLEKATGGRTHCRSFKGRSAHIYATARRCHEQRPHRRDTGVFMGSGNESCSCFEKIPTSYLAPDPHLDPSYGTSFISKQKLQLKSSVCGDLSHSATFTLIPSLLPQEGAFLPAFPSLDVRTLGWQLDELKCSPPPGFTSLTSSLLASPPPSPWPPARLSLTPSSSFDLRSSVLQLPPTKAPAFKTKQRSEASPTFITLLDTLGAAAFGLCGWRENVGTATHGHVCCTTKEKVGILKARPLAIVGSGGKASETAHRSTLYSSLCFRNLEARWQNEVRRNIPAARPLVVSDSEHGRHSGRVGGTVGSTFRFIYRCLNEQTPDANLGFSPQFYVMGKPN